MAVVQHEKATVSIAHERHFAQLSVEVTRLLVSALTVGKRAIPLCHETLGVERHCITTENKAWKHP